MNYYGHMQSELSIEPMLIVLNHKFAFFMEQHFGADQTQEQENLLLEMRSLANSTERQIKVIQGERSEKLIEVYCLNSFFAFSDGDVDRGM